MIEVGFINHFIAVIMCPGMAIQPCNCNLHKAHIVIAPVKGEFKKCI